MSSSQTAASDPAPQTIAKLPGFKFDMGHQETDRVVDELEQVLKTVRLSAGKDAWMPVEAACRMLCTDLGYEDEAEFEVGRLSSIEFGPALKWVAFVFEVFAAAVIPMSRRMHSKVHSSIFCMRFRMWKPRYRTMDPLPRASWSSVPSHFHP